MVGFGSNPQTSQQQPTPSSSIETQWPGYRFVDGNNTYIFKSRVCHPSLFGFAAQNMSCEMLHWDDYCAADPAAAASRSSQQTMRQMFESIPYAPVTVQVAKTNGETETFVLKCIAISEGQYGSGQQNLTQEMLHFDDYMRNSAPTAAAPSPMVGGHKSMESIFRTFYGHGVETFSNSGERIPLLLKCLTTTEQSYGAAIQNLSCEMLHWDDYCLAENIQQSGQTMKSLFSAYCCFCLWMCVEVFFL